MTIEEVRVHRVPLAARATYSMSMSTVAAPESTVVEVVDDDGYVGYGEVCLASARFQPASNDGVRTALGALVPAVIGLDPMQLNRLHRAMDAALLGHHEAKAVIDVACWDLIGKKLDRTVVELLGGQLADPVPTYHVIGIGTPESAADAAVRLQREGHDRLQLKAGGRPIAEDIASIHAVADTLLPGTDLAVDPNRAWTTKDAVQISLACAGVRMSMEQPCATEAELVAIRRRIAHPIIVDESATDLRTIARMISTGLADGFGLKLSRLGGLTPMRAARDLCGAARVPMSSDDAWGGDIIAAAGVALGATIEPALSRGAWLAHPYHQLHYDEVNGPRLDGGDATLPAGGPGLGLVIDRDRLGEPVAVHR